MGAWLALLAICMAALAPAISRALPNSREAVSEWVAVCSADGTHWKQVDPDGDRRQTGGAPGKGHSADCAYCLIQAGPGTRAIDSSAWLNNALRHDRRAAAREPHHPRFSWTVSLSRGPPTLS